MTSDPESATGARDGDRHYPVHLRAVPVLRVTNLVGALVIAAVGIFCVWSGFAIGFRAPNGWVFVALGAPAALYGLLLAPGSQRLEVVLQPDQAIVRGYLVTQPIPRAAIRSITAYPSILWTDDRGRSRTTRVNALNVYRGWAASPNPALVARVQERVDVLRAWAAEPDGATAPGISRS